MSREPVLSAGGAIGLGLQRETRRHAGKVTRGDANRDGLFACGAVIFSVIAILYAFGCQPPATSLYTLTVTGGAGTGVYARGDVVTIQAMAPVGSRFAGWTGTAASVADPNAATTTVTIGENINLTATFVPILVSSLPQYKLTVYGGSGSGVYEAGTLVTIQAEVPGCKQFAEWTGDTESVADPNAASTTVKMTKDITLKPSYTSHVDDPNEYESQPSLEGRPVRPDSFTISLLQGARTLFRSDVKIDPKDPLVYGGDPSDPNVWYYKIVSSYVYEPSVKSSGTSVIMHLGMSPPTPFGNLQISIRATLGDDREKRGTQCLFKLNSTEPMTLKIERFRFVDMNNGRSQYVTVFTYPSFAEQRASGASMLYYDKDGSAYISLPGAVRVEGTNTLQVPQNMFSEEDGTYDFKSDTGSSPCVEWAYMTSPPLTTNGECWAMDTSSGRMVVRPGDVFELGVCAVVKAAIPLRPE